MGDLPTTEGGWPDDDEVDWVRLYVQAPNLWQSYLTDLERRPEPAAVARFVDRCIRSLRCLTDMHARLPGIGLTLARFVELREAAWHAQFDAVAHEERPIGDDETAAERLTQRRAAWQPGLAEALAPEMRAAVINLHLRGLDDTRIACALEIPEDWPPAIIGRAHLNANARAVIRAHLDGKSLGGIEKATGIPPTSALRIIRLVGDQPNGARARVDAAARARDILKLRDRGLAYKEIAARLDCSMDVVKNVLRKDRIDRHRRKGPAA